MKYKTNIILSKLIVFLLFVPYLSYSQANRARLSILNGGNIEVYFNNIQKYKSGITLNQYTLLGITLVDLNSPDPNSKVDGFNINVRSYNGQPSIVGQIPSNQIPLNRIQLEPSNALGLNSATYNNISLSNTWQNLVTYIDPTCPPPNYCDDPPPFNNLHWTTHQIYVTYKIGIPITSGGNGDFLDVYPSIPPDIYTVEIEYELDPIVH